MKRAEGLKLHSCYCRPPSSNPSLLQYLLLLACKSNKILLRPSKIFLQHVGAGSLRDSGPSGYEGDYLPYKLTPVRIV